jgi:glycosyltransferase 2 family protein
MQNIIYHLILQLNYICNSLINILMNKKLKNTIQFLLFISIGVLLFWLVYKDTDFVSLWNEVKKVNYYWFLLELVLFILAHMSRAARWMMLIEPMNYKPRFWNTFYAVLVMYFVNLGLPRMGEVARCGVVAQYDKVPVSKVLGTMITERIFDILMLIFITIIFVIFGGGLLNEFVSQNPGLSENISKLLSPYILVIAGLFGLLGLVMMWLIYKGKFNHIRFFNRINRFIHNLASGLMSFRYVKRKGLFILHTIFIWFVYYIMIFISFQAFHFTVELSMIAALLVFVTSSFGMVAPAPNGMGAWHFMVIQSLILLGIIATNAATFALVVHSLQTVGIIVLGIIAFIALPIINRSNTSKIV